MSVESPLPPEQRLTIGREADSVGLSESLSPAPERPPISILYRNYRGEVAVRRVVPATFDTGLSAMRFAATEWHPTPQWLFAAVDVEKQAWRDFAFSDILAIGDEAIARYRVIDPTPQPRPDAEGQGVVVPAGWKLVPVEPTEAMAIAFEDAAWAKISDATSVSPTEHPNDGGGSFGYGWRAVMKAVPAPIVADEGEILRLARDVAADTWDAWSCSGIADACRAGKHDVSVPVQSAQRGIKKAISGAATPPAPDAIRQPAGDRVMVEKIEWELIERAEIASNNAQRSKADDTLHDYRCGQLGQAVAFRMAQKLVACIATAETGGSGQSAGAGAWRSIESAPKDGMPVLVGWDDGHFDPAKGHYEDGRWGELTGDMRFFSYLAQPTHWQPLPPPPSPRIADPATPSVGREG